MQIKTILVTAALLGSWIALAPGEADAQHRGGSARGGAVVRTGGGAHAVARPLMSRPVVGVRVSHGTPYYTHITWGYPRWWSPFGYWPFWYGPYWYGPYGYVWNDDDSGSLKLQIKPTNADVFVDGYFAGIVDDFDGFFQSLGLAPGNHSVTVWCLGYRAIHQDIYVQPGKSLKLRYQMVPLGAGEPQEPRPVPPPDAQLPPARRGGALQPDQPGSPERPARPRQPARPPLPAEPPQPAPPGVGGEPTDYAQIAIKVQPADAQIFVDGEAWQGSPGTERLVIHLPVGAHRIEIRKDGFRTFATDVQLRAGEATTLNVSLKSS